VDKALKGQVVFDHFDAILGNAEPWLHGLLLHWLGLPCHSLAVDQCFLEEEIWSIINAMPPIRPRVLATSLEDFTKQHGRSSKEMLLMLSMRFGHWIQEVFTWSTRLTWYYFARTMFQGRSKTIALLV
jgi:hypothetical protein